jgi:hypothetical protein
MQRRWRWIFGSKSGSYQDAYMQQTTLMVQQSQTAAAQWANKYGWMGWGSRAVLQASTPPSSTVNDKVNDEVLMTRNDNDDNDDSNNFERPRGTNDKMIAFYNLL